MSSLRVSAGSSLLIALALATSACGPSDQRLDVTYDSCRPLMVALPPDATPAQRGSAAKAIAMWNDLGVTHLTLEPDAAETAVPVRFEDAAGAFLGLYEDETGTLYVNRGLTQDRARAITIAHELGHAFGLLHVDAHDRRSVMNKANLEIPPNADDARALEAARGPCEEESSDSTGASRSPD